MEVINYECYAVLGKLRKIYVVYKLGVSLGLATRDHNRNRLSPLSTPYLSEPLTGSQGVYMYIQVPSLWRRPYRGLVVSVCISDVGYNRKFDPVTQRKHGIVPCRKRRRGDTLVVEGSTTL